MFEHTEGVLIRSVALFCATLLVTGRVIREATPDNANSVVTAAKFYERYLRGDDAEKKK